MDLVSQSVSQLVLVDGRCCALEERNASVFRVRFRFTWLPKWLGTLEGIRATAVGEEVQDGVPEADASGGLMNRPFRGTTVGDAL